MFKKYRKLTPEELSEIKALHQGIEWDRFKTQQIKGNTALVKGGKKLVAWMEQVNAIMENVKKARVTTILRSCGYQQNQQTSINLKTGKVVIHGTSTDGPKTSEEVK